MATSKELHCPRCGGAEFAGQDDRIVCLDCGHSMQFEDLQLVALLDMLVDDVEATRH
jgi:ribosomal protein S27AE